MSDAEQRFNINQYVKVRLNEHGLNILESQHWDLHRHISKPRPFTPPTTDDEGFSRWQLWDLMSRFGGEIMLGRPVPFETEIIIETDSDEITRLKSEVERLRGRCAELELRAVDYLKTASGLAEPKERIKARMKLEDAINHCPDPMPFIRGKQAEAIEDWLNGDAEMGGLDDYAQRLRQQAAEIEGGDDDKP